MSQLKPHHAPNAIGAKALALAFGASFCALRHSKRSYSGVVLVAYFPTSPGFHFSILAQRLTLRSCVIRSVTPSPCLLPLIPRSPWGKPSPRPPPCLLLPLLPPPLAKPTPAKAINALVPQSLALTARSMPPLLGLPLLLFLGVNNGRFHRFSFPRSLSRAFCHPRCSHLRPTCAVYHRLCARLRLAHAGLCPVTQNTLPPI
jgi:hypothetical protein